MHINEERLYIEITDGEGNRLPAGKEGKIIFTTFDNRVMPFIRYDAGDRGIIDGMSCPCGRTLRTIRFTGRSAEIIELPGERQVSLLHIAAAFDIYWNVVRQFQIVQHDPASFVIKVIPGPFFKEAHDKLEERLIRLLHPSVHITWDIVESIPEGPSGKAVYFVRAVKPL
jgi:phenylacetate-CoA ligase